MEAIIISSEADLKRLIQEVMREEMRNLALELNNRVVSEDEGLMTRVEMANYLKISLVTLTDWVKRGLPCIRKGGRVLFQKSDVMTAIKGRPEKNSAGKRKPGI